VAIGKATANGALDVNGNVIITGSLTIFSGSAVDFSVTDTGVKIGNTTSDTHTVTGSFNISGSVNVLSTVTATSFVGNGSGLTGVGGGISQGKVVAIVTGLSNLF
jgi:hypothetical protein